MSSDAPPLAKRYVAFVARWPRAILAAVALVFAGSIALASRLELRTAFSELLPSDDPSIVALKKTHERMGDLSLLFVAIHSPDRAANLRFAEAVMARFKALPPELCAIATYHARDVKAFVEKHKWQYLSETDLEDIRDRLRSEIARRKNPLLVDLGDDDESLDELRARAEGRGQLIRRFPDGVFGTEDGQYVWMAALPPGGIFVEGGGEALYNEALRIIKELEPSGFHPQMHAEVTGAVAASVKSRKAVERDILWVTLTCAVIVMLSIGFYFRRLRAVPLIGLPATVGTVMAFAVGELVFGYLNSSTAFLGSIILGNGINYAIVFISRYEEERARSASFTQALELAVAGVVRATAVASLCASGAYASLMLTSFRGFFQFGVMGGCGVLFCWLATFTVVPALFVLLDRRATDGRRTAPAPLSFAFLGRLVERRATALLALSVVVTALSVRGLTHFMERPFEYDFRKLNTEFHRSEVAKQISRVEEDLFGRWPSPTVVVADRIEEVESIRAAIRRQDTEKIIGDVVTIYDVLPGAPEVQARKLELLAEIRKLKQDKIFELLTDEERKDLDKLDVPAEARALAPDDLPVIARRAFTEVDGTIGRVVLFYPINKGLSIWNGRDLLRIAKATQQLHLQPEDKVLETSGHAVVFGAMLRSVLHDGPRATATALGIVMLIILFVMRPLSSGVAAFVSLVVGVLWMVGIAGLAEVKITFLNFIALPITFGIGAEYAINVLARYRQSGSMTTAIASTGGAVALCSWTTIVGYGSLLAAQNRALRGFGAMAILGEIATLAVAVVALPALILWLARRRAAAEGVVTAPHADDGGSTAGGDTPPPREEPSASA